MKKIIDRVIDKLIAIRSGHQIYESVLYKEAFYFLPLNFRESLIQMREKNAHIKAVEKDFFGFFTKHPLNYSDK